MHTGSPVNGPQSLGCPIGKDKVCSNGMRATLIALSCLALTCQPGCSKTKDNVGSEQSPSLSLLLNRGSSAAPNPYSHTGSVTVASQTDSQLVLQLEDGITLTASNTPINGNSSAQLPQLQAGDAVWADIYVDEPPTPTWEWYITSRINVRENEDGPILFAEVWDTQTVPQDNAGLGMPIRTNQVCSFQTSSDCVKQIMRTEYSLTIQGDAPVTLSPGRSAAVAQSGNKYTAWLEFAQADDYLTPYTCEDGGSSSVFRARLLPASQH